MSAPLQGGAAASTTATRAIELQPDAAEALPARARALQRLRRFEAPIAALERSLLGPAA